VSVLATTRVGRYYRTTVPREVRRLLGIKEGDEVEWAFEDGKVVVRKGAGDVTKCPFCGYEADASKFKPLRDPWKFRFYEVKMLECPRCYSTFNYYFGISPRNGKVSEFVIRIRPGSAVKGNRL